MLLLYSRSVTSNSLKPQRLYPSRLFCPWGFSRQWYWNGLPCPPPGDLPKPGIKLRSPALQADFLLPEPLRKPKNTEVGSLSFLQGIKLGSVQESNQGFLHCRWILYQLSYQASPSIYAAKSTKWLQSCPTLCDPIDGSPPGSPVPGILQARTLEWVAISFSNAWKWKVKVKSLSRICS